MQICTVYTALVNSNAQTYQIISHTDQLQPSEEVKPCVDESTHQANCTSLWFLSASRTCRNMTIIYAASK